MNEQIEVDADSNEYVEPMTTLIGIKCVDGIVMASDSQATHRVERTKTLGATKIFIINNFMTVGGAGNAYDIKLLVEELEKQFSKQPLSEDDTRELIRRIVLGLHKRYNTDQIQYLGERAKELFRPVAVIGIQLKEGDFGLYLVNEDAMVYPIEEQLLGQGAPLARLVMKQVNRSLGVFNVSLSKLSVDHVIKFACYIINEVKDSDNMTGGLTKVSKIDVNGAKELSQDDITDSYNAFSDAFSFGMAKILQISDKPFNWFKGALPKP